MTNSIFENSAKEYDSWFDRHQFVFENELNALRDFIPAGKRGIDIGTGTGRFAAALGISVGVEPAHAMARMAIARGITVINASAELLPFHSRAFDYAMMITTDCFLQDAKKAFREVHRILRKDGRFILGMIDKNSWLGKKYESMKDHNPWYKDAHFHTVPGMTSLLQDADFSGFEYRQTIFDGEEKLTEPLPGFGKGGFVVVCSQKN